MQALRNLRTAVREFITECRDVWPSSAADWLGFAAVAAFWVVFGLLVCRASA